MRATRTPVIGSLPTGGAPTATLSGDPGTHVVQPGESLNSIAGLYGVTVDQLQVANGLLITDTIVPGQVLVIPQPGTPGATPLPPATEQPPLTDNPLGPYSIPALASRSYDGGTITRQFRTVRVAEYEQWSFSYTSDDLYVTGLMNVPSGEGPFPVVILLHGGIDQDVYAQGDGTNGPADFFARNGYLTVAPDYRTYNDTGGSGSPLKIPWVIDVLNLIAALPTLPEADAERIGVWGDSRGGWIAGHLMVISREVDAVTLYAPLHLDQAVVWDLYANALGREWARNDAAIYGSPETNPEGYQAASPYAYLDRVAVPVQIHHGALDGVAPVEWSADLAARLEERGKQVEYWEYPGAEHTFAGADYRLMLDRTLAFFESYLQSDQ